MDLSSLRQDYARGGLDESELAADPFEMFSRWYSDATTAGVYEPNAMIVATATPAGLPSVRTVLLKGVDERGFVFFTNQASRKGHELAANPHTALLFPWHVLERQVRVEGIAEPLARDEVDAYFHSRPRGSRLGAWASPQSRVVADRAALDAAYAEAAERFEGEAEVPTPQEWGGYRVAPISVEFWQGRTSRLHDRLVYRRVAGAESGPGVVGDADQWRTERLAP